MESNELGCERVVPNLPVLPPPPSSIDPVEVREIPLREITIGASCRRSSYSDLDGMVKSIEANGLLQPVSVTTDAEGSFTLVCGSRRYMAHEQLGRTTISCRVINVTPARAAVLALAENVDREDLHPVELARQISSAMDQFGYSEQQIADAIGWSQGSVSTLVGMLALGEDVLKKIGTQPEAPFKRTHAEILAQLMRSTRTTRQVEVQALLKKTIRHKLGTKELRELVRIVRTGGYARLPERLRMSLLRDHDMTSQMAQLYLEPAKVIEGQGKDADQQRQAAGRLEKKWLEDYLVKAVRGRWLFETTRKGLLEAISKRSDPTPAAACEPPSGWERLIADISTLHDRMDVCVNDIPKQAQSNPGQLSWLCSEVDRLRGKLDRFLGVAAQALGQDQQKQVA